MMITHLCNPHSPNVILLKFKTSLIIIFQNKNIKNFSATFAVNYFNAT